MIIDIEGNKLIQSPYNNESELQEILFNHPELLSENEDDEYLSVAREVGTVAGRIDVLMLSKNGNVVIVEVKLGRNQQSRREIVAQIIDYVSTLSDLSVYELDEKTRGKLEEKVEETEFDLQTVDKLLRNASIEVILAVDESNDDLARIVQFLAEHTDFKIKLVEISKHKDDQKTLLSSSIIFAKDDSISVKNSNTRLLDSSEITTIVNAWNESEYAKTNHLFTSGSAASYRQIRVAGWKPSLHYEFTKYRNGTVSVRLDNEIGLNDPLKLQIKDILQTFSNHEVAGKKLIVTDKLAGNKIYTEPFRPNEVKDLVLAMEQLIELTRSTIEEKAPNIMSRRSPTTFAMLDIPIGSKLHFIKDPSIIAITVDENNLIKDANGKERTISNYSDELVGGSTSGFDRFMFNNKKLIDIRFEKGL